MKNTFKVTPFVGIEYISFGMSRSKIGEAMLTNFSCPSQYEPPMQGYLETGTDFFHELGINVYYDNNDLCDGICLYRPANATFQRKHLLGNNRSLKKWKEWLDSINGQTDVLDKNWTALASYTYGLEFVGQELMTAENNPPYVLKLHQKGFLENEYKRIRKITATY